MGFYQFKREQFIQSTIDEVWDFISSPKNLQEITPESMGFEITSSDLPDKMYPGMIISYNVKPLLGIKTTWVTEITHVEDKKYFVDEQRVGPYSIWHHEHILEETNDGVNMIDIISYKPPFGMLGNIANAMIIKSKLKQIFDYRFQVLEKKYNS